MCYGRVVCSKIQALIGPGFGILGVTAKHQAEFPCYDKWPVDAAFIFHLQNCLRAPRPPRGPLIAVQAPSSSSACIARGKFRLRHIVNVVLSSGCLASQDFRTLWDHTGKRH